MIIDVHVHIGRGERLDDSYQVDCTLESILHAMEGAGVDISCIMPVLYDDYEIGIREVREAMAVHPDRLIGFARVSMRDEKKALEQVARCFDEYGFKGLKMHPATHDGFPTRRLMELLSEHGAPLLLHGVTQEQMADAIVELARAYPKVPIICGHMGGLGVYWPTYVKLYALAASQLPNFYLDISFVFLHTWIELAIDICGTKKVLFASDGPVGQPAVALKQLELCGFSESELEPILSGNAKVILNL